MKKIITLHVLLSLLLSQLSAQTKDDYLLKSKHQKTTAWVLLGAGLTLDFIGTYELLYGISEIGNGQHHNKIGASIPLILLGGAAAIISIPLFIASPKNKHKAMSITLSNQLLPALVKNTTVRRSLPSIGLQFKL